MFRILRRWLDWWPAAKDNYWPVKSRRMDSPLVVDLLDLQTYIHTVPVLSRGSNEFALQSDLLRPGMVFLDVGANYGLYTLYAAHRVGSSGCVVAIEPQPRLVGALQETVRLLSIPSVSIVNAAASDVPGKATFHIPTMASGTGSLLSSGGENDGGVAVDVEVSTIDEICRRQGINRVDLIKIDVEGFEYKALTGASEIIRKSRPLIWFELNPEAQQRAGVSIGELFRLFENLGYRTFYRISRGYPAVHPYDSFYDLINVLAFPEGHPAIDRFPDRQVAP